MGDLVTLRLGGSQLEVNHCTCTHITGGKLGSFQFRTALLHVQYLTSSRVKSVKISDVSSVLL